MPLKDIRIDYIDENGHRITKVLVNEVEDDKAHAMLGERWDETSLVAGLYDLISETFEWSDIYICDSSDPMGQWEE